MIDVEIEENETQESNESNYLFFDPTVVKTQGQSTTSLEDIYGYHVFSLDFISSVNEYMEKKENEHDDILNAVLMGEKNKQIDKVFSAVINGERNFVVQTDYTSIAKHHDNPIFITCFVVLGMIVAFVVWIAIEKVLKGKNDNEVDAYDNVVKR